MLGCELTEDGYLKTDPFHETAVKGVYACGDNATFMRTVANAVSTGTTTGMMANKALIEEAFFNRHKKIRPGSSYMNPGEQI